MRINSNGLELIKSFEGLRLKAYKLKGEIFYTIGYGHSDISIRKDTVWTKSKAECVLAQDLVKFENYVNTYAAKKFPTLNSNQFSALVSYCYNRGPKGLKQLVTDSVSISDMGYNIVKYWGSNTNYKDALIKRRKKEQELYFKSMQYEIPQPVLKRGSTGQEVVKLQYILNELLGCGLIIDGKYGPATEAAVKRYQSTRVGLAVDGKYGPATHQKITKEVVYGNKALQ